MTRKPLVSIGVPVRNGGELIEEALELLVNQTYDNIEIIISNNNSTDQTEDICRRFQAKDKRIKYYRHNKDLNAVENFKFVFENSTGEFFMWAAHDDRRSLNYVEVLLEKMIQEPKASIVFSDVAKFSYFNEWKNAKPIDYDFECSVNSNYWKRIINRSFIRSGYLHIYGLINRKILSEYKWKEIEKSPDKPLIFYLSCRGDFKYAPGTCIFIYKPLEKKDINRRAKDNFYIKIRKFPRVRISWACAQIGHYAEQLEGRNRNTVLSFILFLFDKYKERIRKIAVKLLRV